MTLEAISVGRARAYPPRVTAFTQTFWEGLGRGQWQTTCCEDCGKFTFPPKPVCPHCWSERMAWKPLSHRGSLYSWTRVHAAPKVFVDESPYALCVVDLEIGLRIATRLVERPGKNFQCGMPVELVVLQFDDGPLLGTRPL
ncbi:MAG: putative nucleic-acid-binding protein containing a Zn-ribbon [Pseudomonadota bacterium]|jgi:uncharacterized OB-fold protein